MDPNPYPLVFEPRVKARVWGGTRLQEDFGRPQMEGDTPCGESWEMADLPGDSSVVTRGELEGVTLSTLVQEHPKWLMGEAPLLEGRFPLLLKLLDAEKTLSVQVHPDEEAAKRLDGRPKTEAWIILETQPGACLYLGLKEGVTPRELREACKGESLEGVVHRVEVEPMDVVFIPAGTVHAIGAGLVLAELQQASDTTYRLHDWGRMGLDGKPRELHIKQALESIHFHRLDPPLWRPRKGPGRVVDGPAFVMEVHHLDGSDDKVFSESRPVCAVCLEGRVSVASGVGKVHLPRGGVCLAPAAAERVTCRGEGSGRATLLVAWPTKGPCRNKLDNSGRQGAPPARTEEQGNLNDSERETQSAGMDRRSERWSYSCTGPNS